MGDGIIHAHSGKLHNKGSLLSKHLLKHILKEIYNNNSQLSYGSCILISHMKISEHIPLVLLFTFEPLLGTTDSAIYNRQK